jgi:hypothetical protein
MQRTDGNLYLHLNCEGCDKAAQLILINGHRNKTKRKKDRVKNKKVKKGLRDLKPFRARKKRRLNRTRPFLIDACFLLVHHTLLISKLGRAHFFCCFLL